MKSKEAYQDDLKMINQYMSRSSRFVSLSGISGILVGLIALTSAYLAYTYIYRTVGYEGSTYKIVVLTAYSLKQIIGLACLTLFLSLGVGFYFSWKKSQKVGEKLLSPQSKQLLVSMMIPLSVGGLVCLFFLLKGLFILVAPLTLIFYGLSLINGSQFSLNELKSLGILEIILGLIGLIIGNGIVLWAIGFGALHIIYGIIMFIKYDR